MSAHLLPCPSCRRHVRVDSAACPFCTFLLSDAFRTTPARPLPTRRLGRAATFAFGAAIAGATACGPHGDTRPAPEGDQSGSVGEIYGGPPSPPPPAPPSATPPATPPGSADPAYGGPPPMPPPPATPPPATPPPAAPPSTPPPPGPSGGARSGGTVRMPTQLRQDDPGSMVALYGLPFDPSRIGGGDGIGGGAGIGTGGGTGTTTPPSGGTTSHQRQ